MRARQATLLLFTAGCGSYGLDAFSDNVASTDEITLVVVPRGEIAFGQLILDDPPESQDVTMGPRGEDPTSVVDVYLDEARSSAVFSVDTGSLEFPRPIQPGGSLTVAVSFDPYTAGSFQGKLVIEYEINPAGDVGEVTRDLSGSACKDYDGDGECG